MKKILISLVLIALMFSVKGQYPVRQPIGTVNTENYAVGSYGTTTGLRFINSFADTTAANNFATVNIKAIPGFVIRVVSDLYMRNNAATKWVQIGSGSGAGLTSVGLSMPSGFTVSNSPLTSNGTIAVTGAGTTAQYIRGDGSLATYTGGAQTWNSILDPTGDQSLTFGVGESSTWTNQNTTEDLMTWNSSTMTTSSMLSVNSTSTALAAGNNLGEFVMSGVNGTSGITATGLRVSVTNTHASANTNVGLNVTASGAFNNYAALFNGGNVGIGNTTPTAKLGIIGSTQGPLITMNNGAQSNYIEFSKTGFNEKGSVGALGGFEMNMSYNMDYYDGTHRYYDATKGATWMALFNGGWQMQYAPSGSTPDIWNNTGSKLMLYQTYNGHMMLNTDATLAAAGSDAMLTVPRDGSGINISGTDQIIIEGAKTSGVAGDVFLNNYNAGNVIIAQGGGVVGIGTVPVTNQRVTIRAKTASNDALRIENHLGAGVGEYYIDGSGNSEFYLRNASSTLKVLLSSVGDNYINVGNVGFGTTTPSATIDLVGTLQYTDGNQGSNKVLTSDASGNATWQNPATSGTVTGTGTTNTLPKWTSSTAIGNSSITDNGTSVAMMGGTSSGTNSLAIGSTSNASGNYSFATSFGTASGLGSVAFAEGTSSGTGAFSGYQSISSGNISFSYGSNSIASGTSSVALQGNAASGANSAAFGGGTIANNIYNFTVGAFNDSTAGTTRIFQIGNGTGNTTRSNAMTVLLNGNVGIGTTTPAVPLSVVGAISGTTTINAGTSITSPLLIGGTGTTSTLTYKTTTGVGASGADHIFQVGNNGATEAMRIMNAGNVGVGTNAPGSHLQLGTAFNGYTPSGTLDFAVGSTSVPSRFFFGQSLSTYGGLVWNYNATTSSAFLTIGAGNSGPAPTYISQQINLLQNGNVGIGLTAPTATLHLKAGTATASTAPLKFTSGTLNTTAEAGAVEFLTDAYYGTITTGAARKKFAFVDLAQTFTGVQSFTSPDVTTSLTTPSTTFSLANTTATTVNAFGAATTLNIGASAATVLNLGGSTSAAELRFLEPSGAGTNYVGIKSPATLAGNTTYTLPNAYPAVTGYVLSSTDAGAMSWIAAGGGGWGTTGTVATLTGASTLAMGGNTFNFSSGKVGIGTTPTATLHVSATNLGAAGKILLINHSEAGTNPINSSEINLTAANTGDISNVTALSSNAFASGNSGAIVELIGLRGTGDAEEAGGTVSTVIGVQGLAGSGTTAIGVYGSAEDAGTNWAGWFGAGNFYVQNSVQFDNYGAGTATFDASGNITSVSDERLKTSIKPYQTGLKELMNVKPIQYRWNTKSGMETKGTYAGFSAQNVKENIPFGTGENAQGYLSLQDRALLAASVNAIRELKELNDKQQAQIEELKKQISQLLKQK